MALANNLSLEIEGIDIHIQETGVQDALADFDPSLNFRAIYESIENPQNQQEFIATRSGTTGLGSDARLFEEENVRLESSIDGKTPLGTEWSLVAESDRLKNTLNIDRPPSLFYPEYDTFVGVRLTQPLMRGFGVKTQLSKVRLAAADKQLASIDWQRNLRAIVAEISKGYYDLIFAREDEDIKRRSIGLAESLAAGNQKRLDEGVASAIEVRQAEVAVSVRQEALISAQHFYRETQNLLIRQLYRDFDILNPPRLRPTGQLGIEISPINEEALLGAALANRPEYLANLEQLAKQDIQIRFYKNQLLPRVDLVGTLGGNGLDGTFGGGFEDAASRNGVQWSAGLVVSIPIGNRREKAQIQARQLEKRQLVLNLKQVEMDIAVQIDTAISRIATTRQRLETANRSVDLARQTLEEEEKRLVEGVTNSFQILAAQEDLATAETRELAAQVDLHKSIIDLWLASGTLLEHLGIVVPEPSTKKEDVPDLSHPK